MRNKLGAAVLAAAFALAYPCGAGAMENREAAAIYKASAENHAEGFSVSAVAPEPSPGESVAPETIIFRALPPDHSTVEIRMELSRRAFEKIRLSNFQRGPLTIYHYGRNFGGELRPAGVAYTVPHTRIWRPFAAATIYFVENSIENPYSDRNSIVTYLEGTNARSFQKKLNRIEKALVSAGVDARISGRPRDGKRLINKKGATQSFLYDLENSFSHLRGLYLSSYIMPRKAASKGAAGEEELIANLLSEKTLASLKTRAYSSLGRPIPSYHLDIGNETKVYLSYGPGISYGDVGAPLMIFSLAPVFIDKTELIDRDSFYFKSRIERRDPLSEAWHSVIDDESRETGHALRGEIDGFVSRNRLDSFIGRLAYLRKLDAFFEREGLCYDKRLASALCEEYNNEVRVADILDIERFAECLIMPARKRERVLRLLRERGVSKIAGIPAEEFIIPAIETGGRKIANIDYIAYFLRECKAPEYDALKRAEAAGDTGAMAAICESVKGARLAELVACVELEKSRSRRARLRAGVEVPANAAAGDTRSGGNGPGNNPYATDTDAGSNERANKHLPKQSTEREPGKRQVQGKNGFSDAFPPDGTKNAGSKMTAKPDRAGEFDVCRLSVMFERVEAAATDMVPPQTPDHSARPARPEENIRYIKIKNGEFLADPRFLELVRARCGDEGIYHIIAHEYLAHFRGSEGIFEATDRLMRRLGMRARFVELAKTLELSAKRREAIMRAAISTRASSEGR